jgi:hypothetical protein
MRIKKHSTARRTGPILTASDPRAEAAPSTPATRTTARPGDSPPAHHPPSAGPRPAVAQAPPATQARPPATASAPGAGCTLPLPPPESVTAPPDTYGTGMR